MVQRFSTGSWVASRLPICYRADVQTTPPQTAVANAPRNSLERWITEAVGRPLFWASVIGVLLGFTAFLIWRQDMPPVPMVYAELPDFQLTDQDERPFGKKNMEGRVWIVDFVFTRCPTVCTTLSERMSKLQVRLRNTGGDVRLLSISVDPEHDTPAVLKEYAKSSGGSPGSGRGPPATSPRSSGWS